MYFFLNRDLVHLIHYWNCVRFSSVDVKRNCHCNFRKKRFKKNVTKISCQSVNVVQSTLSARLGACTKSMYSRVPSCHREIILKRYYKCGIEIVLDTSTRTQLSKIWILKCSLVICMKEMKEDRKKKNDSHSKKA